MVGHHVIPDLGPGDVRHMPAPTQQRGPSRGGRGCTTSANFGAEGPSRQLLQMRPVPVLLHPMRQVGRPCPPRPAEDPSEAYPRRAVSRSPSGINWFSSLPVGCTLKSYTGPALMPHGIAKSVPRSLIAAMS